MPRDALSSKDAVGATLDAAFRWFDTPGPPPGVPVVNEALKRAREKTDLKLSIDLLAVGRMRIVLSSVAFALPLNTELRARSDRYGHVLVWPDGAAYRLVTPGALRAMLAERRADVTALVAAKSRELGRGSLLGLSTTRSELSTRTGTVVIEQAEFGGLGGSGALLCRSLVELVGAEPMSRTCESGRLPLRAEYRWPNGGRLEFEVKAITRRQDLLVGNLFVPPPGAVFKIGELPPQADGVLLTRDDLAGLRSRPIAPTKAPGPRVARRGLHGREQRGRHGLRVDRRYSGELGAAALRAVHHRPEARRLRGFVARLPRRRRGAAETGRTAGSRRAGAASAEKRRSRVGQAARTALERSPNP